MKNKVLLGLMLASSLTACGPPEGAKEARAQIANDKNIVHLKKVVPELEMTANVFYNFNDSTQTITREFEPYERYATYSFSRRGMDELKGTEKAELDSIITARKGLNL